MGSRAAFSRVVGARREGRGLLGDLRLGRRGGLTEVEEALLRRSHLPTTRHASARHGCAGWPKTCRELRCCPAPPPPPPPPATDACCNRAREGNDRRRAGSHAPVPTGHTRRPRGSTGLLGCWGSGANAHHGDLGGPRHGDALHARHGRGRRERRGKAARNERGGSVSTIA